MYDIDSALGEGAFATVLKALHRREGKFYAVKTFKAEKLRPAGDGREVALTTNHLQKEIQVLERLKHPNVCQLKEAFYEGDSISECLETDSTRCF